MNKSKEFDSILDECLERILVKGEDLAKCLESYPEHVAELKPLLETVLAIRRTAAVNPRLEFAARARYQFQVAVREAQARKRRRLFIWQPVWATILSVILAVLISGGVTVAAAGNSMPDEALYPVKVATEQVRLALTPSPVGKAELSAELADRRVAEIVHLVKKSEPTELELEAAVERLKHNLERIAVLCQAKKERAVTGAPVPKATPRPDVRGTPAPAPAPARAPAEAAERSLTVPASPKATWEQGAGEPEVRIPPKTERERLKLAIISYARCHPEALREALKKAPESAKPVLRRAIIMSEEGYRRARQSLD